MVFTTALRPLIWPGDSREVVRSFPVEARDHVGAEAYRLQIGLDPKDCKPMATAVTGVREFRARTSPGND